MNIVMFVLFFVGMFALMLLISYLDAKKGWRLNAWLSGECTNPFETSSNKREDKINERLANLEKIVTEPAYELNKKINALR
jgi:hypothetical protein